MAIPKMNPFQAAMVKATRRAEDAATDRRRAANAHAAIGTARANANKAASQAVTAKARAAGLEGPGRTAKRAAAGAAKAATPRTQPGPRRTIESSGKGTPRPTKVGVTARPLKKGKGAKYVMTPGIVDHPKAYAKRHPNAVVLVDKATGKGVAGRTRKQARRKLARLRDSGTE